jgi:hypothetical protein
MTDGECLIENCKNVATLNSTVQGEGLHGSYVGKNGTSDEFLLTIEGCVFAGSLLGPNTDHVSGFVGEGWAIELLSCLFAPASVTMSGNGSGTFMHPYPNEPEAYPKDAFYIETLGEAQGNPNYSISAGSDAYSLAFGNPTATYDVSGIEAFATDNTTYLLKYGGACYALAGKEISFTINGTDLNHCSIAGDGGQLITPEEANGHYTFTMPEASVTVYAMGDNVTVTVGSQGRSSFCSPCDLDFTQAKGVKAYVVSGFSPSTMSITLTQADYVPAGTGLVVTGAEGTYNVPIAATDKVWANLLVGVNIPTSIAATDNGYSNFILTDGSNGYNWYAATGGTLPAGEAYLRLPTRSVTNYARSFTWIFEDNNPSGISTDIHEMQTANSQDNDAWYTLNGIRLNGKPSKKGVYIVNGKAVVR